MGRKMVHRRLSPRVCTWNSDGLWIADSLRWKAKLLVVKKLLQSSDVLHLQEAGVRRHDLEAVSLWFERLCFRIPVNFSTDSGWGGVLTAARATWLCGRELCSIQGTAHHTPITQVGMQGAEEFEVHMSLVNVYLQSGNSVDLESLRLEQICHLGNLLRQHCRRIQRATAVLGHTLTLISGDMNFISSRGDRCFFATGNHSGHWTTNEGVASSTAWENLISNQGFLEVGQDFAALRGRNGAFMGNNDRHYHNMTASRDQTSVSSQRSRRGAPFPPPQRRQGALSNVHYEAPGVWPSRRTSDGALGGGPFIALDQTQVVTVRALGGGLSS